MTTLFFVVVDGLGALGKYASEQEAGLRVKQLRATGAWAYVVKNESKEWADAFSKSA